MIKTAVYYIFRDIALFVEIPHPFWVEKSVMISYWILSISNYNSIPLRIERDTGEGQSTQFSTVIHLFNQYLWSASTLGFI